MVDLSSLNENQQKAICWDKGPLLVLAGPGSGKTRVLTLRIARILELSPGQHFRLLALTFTNKAAAEMRSRVELLVSDELNRLCLTTFHFFAAELLRQHGNHLGYRTDFQILSNDDDRKALLDDVLEQIRKDIMHAIPEHFQAAQILPAITRLIELRVPPSEAASLLQNAQLENAAPLARVYAAYRDALRQTNCLDFPSLIAESIELLSNIPFLLKHIRKVYKHILVDEFQDTNYSQHRMLSLITRPDPSTLFVAADDDQIISQCNCAHTEMIQNLRDEFNVSVLYLPENYSCPPKVIQLANALIEKNTNRSPKKQQLKAIKQNKNGKIVRFFKFNTLDDEVYWIANDIKNRDSEEQGKCAILARTKKLLNLAGDKLKVVGLPVYFADRKNEFHSAPLRMLYAILRLANSNDDKQSLAHLSKAFYDSEGIVIELPSVLSRASADGKDLLRSWLDEVKRQDSLNEQTRYLIEKGIVSLLNSLNYRNFSDNLFKWASDRQKDLKPEVSSFNEFEDEREVWNNLINRILIKYRSEDISLFQLLHDLALISKNPPKSPNAIPCFTIHASKGMEFGHVYLMGLVEGQLPSWTAVKMGDNSLEMQEERRNCFVAMTRTQNSLTLTCSTKVFDWIKKPSRFLMEIGFGKFE